MNTNLTREKLDYLLKQVTECHNIILAMYERIPPNETTVLINSKEIIEEKFISPRTLREKRKNKILIPLARRKSYLYDKKDFKACFKNK